MEDKLEFIRAQCESAAATLEKAKSAIAELSDDDEELKEILKSAVNDSIEAMDEAIFQIEERN